MHSLSRSIFLSQCHISLMLPVKTWSRKILWHRISTRPLIFIVSHFRQCTFRLIWNLDWLEDEIGINMIYLWSHIESIICFSMYILSERVFLGYHTFQTIFLRLAYNVNLPSHLLVYIYSPAYLKLFFPLWVFPPSKWSFFAFAFRNSHLM